MNCKQAESLFDAYLDETLTGSLATEFAAHRLRCADCRRQLALMEVTGQIIASDNAAAQLGDAFTGRVVARAVQTPRSILFRPRGRRVAGSVLAAAACVALAFVYWPQPDTRVKGYQEQVTSEQLRANVESALARDPENAQLQQLARELNHDGRRWLHQTLHGATELENYGKETIIEVLESIRIDSNGLESAAISLERASAHEDGQPVNTP